MNNRGEGVDTRLVTDFRRLPPRLRVLDSREGIPDEMKQTIATADQAKRLAVSTGLDLVLISPDATPPVYRLVDYGKFRYEEEKRQKAALKKQRESSRGMKEHFFNVACGDHDFRVKIAQIRDHLSKHDVRVGVKATRQNRLSLQRGQSLQAAARQDDFVLNRVLVEMNDEIQPTNLQINDRVVFAVLRKKAA